MLNLSRWMAVFVVLFSAMTAAHIAVAAEGQTRPNILFCIADDWGWPHAGAYGAGSWVQTPGFDRIAKEGVLFENCFTSNPKCSPCRATILAGRNSWQMKEAVSHFSIWPNEFVTYPDLFIKAGYHVGLTGKGWGPGDWKSFRETNPAGPSYDAFKAPPPASGISNNDYSRNFIEGFLKARPSKETPFCFWLGATEPHRGYEVGSGIQAGKKLKDAEVPKFYPDHNIVRSDLLDYAVEVEHFDRHVGKVLDYLQKTGELDNTIVVMTSDHGMPFPRVKGQIYEYGFHLPLAVRWGAKVKPGRVVKDFINARDFAPTFLEAAGLDKHEQITGESFLELLLSEKSGVIDGSKRNVMLIGKERHDIGRPDDVGYPVRAIRTPDYLYVHNFAADRWPAGNPETGYRNVDDGATKSFLLSKFDDWYGLSFGMRPEEELYLVGQDPECLKNLASLPEHQAMKQHLRLQMEQLLKAEGDPRMLGQETFFDTIEYVGNKSHGWDAWIKHARSPVNTPE
jgi:N-sulfoglucosamine sulfohydrolase